MNSDVQCSRKSLGTISCDQEAWLKDRLVSLVLLGIEINARKKVGADALMIEKALEGAVEGQALEILLMLNLEPAYINLPKRTWWISDRK